MEIAPPIVELRTGEANEIANLDAFLRTFDADPNFAYTKINHGFWEALADVETEAGWPASEAERMRADKIAKRPHFFVGGFVDELLALLKRAAANHPESLHLCFELSAWPGDNQIIGTPFRPERSRPVFERFVGPFRRLGNGLLLKQAVNDGSIVRFFERLRDHQVVLVGPQYLSPFFDLVGVKDGAFVPLHPNRARKNRDEAEALIRSAIARADKPPVVLLQAGTLAPYWILRMHRDHPGVRWVDGGLAFSICHPPDILRRPWGRIFRKEILETYEALGGEPIYPKRETFAGVDEALRISAEVPPRTAEVAFVEDKVPNLERVAEFLKISARHNHWTNRGPLHWTLARAFHTYFQLADDQAVVPCANGGIALEALARLHDARAARALRWVVSAFSFLNLGRGYFSYATIVDCDRAGLLSLEDLAELPIDSYDGIVVTNPFGICKNFDRFRNFAQTHDKALLLDNAAGVCQELPRVEYQSLSLHHTKPYGVGEGGLAVLPATEAEAVFALLNYGELAAERTPHWLSNGKLSDPACAFHLDRLERSPQWLAHYEMQATRMLHIGERAGLRPLLPIAARTVASRTVAMSLPFLAKRPVTIPSLTNSLLVLGKYYKPLASLPRVSSIYERIVNVPCHPDVARLDTEELVAMLKRVADE